MTAEFVIIGEDEVRFLRRDIINMFLHRWYDKTKIIFGESLRPDLNIIKKHVRQWELVTYGYSLNIY